MPSTFSCLVSNKRTLVVVLIAYDYEVAPMLSDNTAGCGRKQVAVRLLKAFCDYIVCSAVETLNGWVSTHNVSIGGVCAGVLEGRYPQVSGHLRLLNLAQEWPQRRNLPIAPGKKRVH